MRGLGAFLAALLLAGCGGGGEKTTPADRAMEERILLRGNGAEPESLDPHLATSVSAGKVLINLFEGLTRPDPATLEPQPAMAERWEVSEDGLSYTFHLREAAWSDGAPVTAGDFVFGFRRLLDPELGASYAFMLYPLKHARAVNRGERPVEDLGVEAVDDRTLALSLDQPTPYLLSLLYHWTAFPLPEHVVARFGTAANRASAWTRPENLVGNGAFTVAEWAAEDVIRLEKNPGYWQAGEVWLEGAEFRPFTDASAEERAFRGGRLHLTYALPRSRLEHYRAERPEVLRVDPYLESNGYIVNVRRPVLDDPRVRRALSLALDRRAVTEQVLNGVRDPAFTYVPPGTAGFQSAVELGENVEEARRLLAEAGYPGGEGFPELELILASGQDPQNVAQVAQQFWLTRLGVGIVINNLERKTYFSRRSAGEFDLCFLGWVGDYVDPTTFLDLWRSEATGNPAGWENPDYDRLLVRAALAGEERMAVLAEAEALLLRDLPIIPLYFGATQYLKDPRVEGWRANLLDRHPLRAVRFSRSDPRAD